MLIIVVSSGTLVIHYMESLCEFIVKSIENYFKFQILILESSDAVAIVFKSSIKISAMTPKCAF